MTVGAVSRLWCLMLVGVVLSGCATTANRQTPQLRRDTGQAPRIVVMPIDVELSELSAGGVQQPNAAWTDAARTHMKAALEQEAKSRSVKLADFNADAGSAEDRDLSAELVKLHRAVGTAAFATQMAPLPSKEGKFDWSLGPDVAAIARTQQADYALFIFLRDSYASGGRVALMIVGAALGVAMPGGAQVGFASLVDLRSGDLVWFHRLLRGQGDLRTPAAAEETVKTLVADALK